MSASLTLAPPHPFPGGTSVDLYEGVRRSSGPPSGSPVASATVNASSLTLTFTGIDEAEDFFAYANGQSVAIRAPLTEVVPPARLVNPTGVNDSATILAALASLGRAGQLTLGPGVWRAALGTIGSTTAGAGVNYSIRGEGPYKTILAPVDATAGIFKVAAPGDSSSDFFELDDIGICLPFDMDYAKPLVEIALQKGQLQIGEHVRFYCGDPSTPNNTASFMGTHLKLDGAYEGKILAKFRTRKYAIPYEVVNLTTLTGLGVPPNWDTIKFGGTIDGVHGPIFRNAYSKAHGLIFDPFKITARSEERV